MPDFDKGIASVRFRHPTEDRELEVRINAKDTAVDAVFITVDAVEKILLPFYQRMDPAAAEDLLKKVQKQQENGICLALHKDPCRRAVPRIDWKAKSPIKLGPCDWQSPDSAPGRPPADH